MKTKRNVFGKLNTLLFGKDLRITKGERYTEEREYDYTSYLPTDNYVQMQELPSENAYYITDFGAAANDKSVDNSKAINDCIETCYNNGGGYVIVSGGSYTSKTVKLRSNVTLFIEYGSSIVADESGEGFENKAFIFADTSAEYTGEPKSRPSAARAASRHSLKSSVCTQETRPLHLKQARQPFNFLSHS